MTGTRLFNLSVSELQAKPPKQSKLSLEYGASAVGYSYYSMGSFV